MLILGPKQLIYLFASIIVRRVIETQLFWDSFRVIHASPALTKQPRTMFISMGLHNSVALSKGIEISDGIIHNYSCFVNLVFFYYDAYMEHWKDIECVVLKKYEGR